jgi:hypothetical protein
LVTASNDSLYLTVLINALQDYDKNSIEAFGDKEGEYPSDCNAPDDNGGSDDHENDKEHEDQYSNDDDDDDDDNVSNAD